MSDFEPRIIAFCCQHCAYAAADLAGGARLSYPDSLRIVQLPCTGRVDVLHVLKSFEEGADGVLVAGCLPGLCHYLKGNLHARQRIDYVRRMLDQIGFESDRARMINISAAMGARFAELATEFGERIRELGPNRLAAPTPATPQFENLEATP
ncbi:MAG: hydrogenase iron-sulfur subunit [Alphaproteobacteria bacterium]|jgi:coenzyme F420-reducing hydrogenase delta subunit|nr:hydrogenase iron-sulfur subunit [Alphaproteobacteria bacterium]MDP6270085.1 hydrogenase iron-sulfur subunit [Alphaproteobacteria bacterium]